MNETRNLIVAIIFISFSWFFLRHIGLQSSKTLDESGLPCQLYWLSSMIPWLMFLARPWESAKFFQSFHRARHGKASWVQLCRRCLLLTFCWNPSVTCWFLGLQSALLDPLEDSWRPSSNERTCRKTLVHFLKGTEVLLIGWTVS